MVPDCILIRIGFSLTFRLGWAWLDSGQRFQYFYFYEVNKTSKGRGKWCGHQWVLWVRSLINSNRIHACCSIYLDSHFKHIRIGNWTTVLDSSMSFIALVKCSFLLYSTSNLSRTQQILSEQDILYQLPRCPCLPPVIATRSLCPTTSPISMISMDGTMPGLGLNIHGEAGAMSPGLLDFTIQLACSTMPKTTTMPSMVWEGKSPEINHMRVRSIHHLENSNVFVFRREILSAH
jgi:hypothetical protein